MYCIIDIETTGLSPEKEKITEIAIFVHDGTKVIEEFVSLVNPERLIPYYITRMTGITNEMVENAPKFYEIARKIIEITENRVFVAHNVEFDYGFIKAEFASLGYEFTRNRLCTVKLCKKIIPGHSSYSLGKITEKIGIKISGRHRAAGDAFATVKLFEFLLGEDARTKPLIEEMSFHSVKNLHPDFDRKILEKIPEKTGVYYFYDDKKELIYVGKSKSIRSRIFQHFSNNLTRKAIEMKSKITDISYELTGSELVALLLESNEIKKYKPLYNRSQRRTSFHFGIYKSLNESGYLNFEIRKNTGQEIPISSFINIQSARSFMEEIVVKYELCQKLCGLYKSNGSCFNYGIKACRGACLQNESSEEYNQRANNFIKSTEYKYQNFLIIEKGRHSNEKSVIYIRNGSYQGFGYVDIDFASSNLEVLTDCVKKYPDNRDIQIIIKGYVNRNQVERLIPINNEIS